MPWPCLRAVQKHSTGVMLCRGCAEDQKGNIHPAMSIARLIRSALGLAALFVVVWAFYKLTEGAIARRHAQRDRPITLTILHWGNPAEDRIDRDLVTAF